MPRFWWLDLNTFIMEPSLSLQKHIFNDLQANTYRDINVYNPKNFSHPPTQTYLEPESLSPVGDNKLESIAILLTQDCSGFNLGSFFMRRGTAADRLMDIWWDPVAYEQKHMQWEHNEQDALESIYRNQPWIRTHVAFLPQRKINSFPAEACSKVADEDKEVEKSEDREDKKDDKKGEEKSEDEEEEEEQEKPELILDPQIHYNEKERDFMVNMAGCQWGRDCWGEIYNFRNLSNHLNRNSWEKFKDWIRDSWKALWGIK